MDVYDRIAQILTDLYKSEDKLPETFPAVEYTHIAYVDKYEGSGEKVFAFGGKYTLKNGKVLDFYKRGPDFREAIKRAWPYLDETEKTKLMTEVLGCKQ